MSFQQGLSGLNAAARNLSVIGNNVANANTVGFKESRTEFSDVYANTVLGTTKNAVGLGTKVATVSRMFSQGGITTTDNPFDVAISGNGFFRMNNNGSILYSRNGQFHRDNEGYLVNADGYKLTGYQASKTGEIVPIEPLPLLLQSTSLEARSTGEVRQGAILDSREPAIIEADHPFDPSNSETYTHATSVSVFDSLGNSHLLSTYYVKRDAGTWDTYVLLNGDAANQQGPFELRFDTSGVLEASSDSRLDLTFPASMLDTGAADMNIAYDLVSTTQTGRAFSNEMQYQDGYTSGMLSSFSIDEYGMLVANFSNEMTRVIGQIALVQFVNPQGLSAVGGNNFVETASSGTPRVGTAGSSDFGVLMAGALEDSNVDLTEALVNMITAQRVYQSVAQSIKTEDSVMQTLVNLR